MKTSGLLLIVFIVIAVVGGGLSLTGYNESQQITTSTSTYTTVVTRTSTATSVTTSILGHSIYHQNVTSLQGLNRITFNRIVFITCPSERFDFHVDEGRLHISYNVNSTQTVHPPELGGVATTQLGVGEVDFWLVNDEGLHEIDNVTNSCTMQRSVMGIAHDFGSTGYDSTVDIPSSGTYHIVFINNYRDAIITLNVDCTSPPTAVTGYSTHTNTFTTEMMKAVSQPTGLGMPFYSGIGLVAVAVIAIAVAMKRRGRVAPPATTSTGARPSPPQGPQGKFCMNCGAPLPSHAPYCSECGSKQ